MFVRSDRPAPILADFFLGARTHQSLLRQSNALLTPTYHPVSISVDVSIGSQKIPGYELRSYMVFPKVRNLWAEGRPLGWLARKLEPEEL